jgi:hypothetical protein
MLVRSNNVLYGPWGHWSPLDLGNEGALQGIGSNSPDEVTEDPCIEARVAFDPLLNFFEGKGARVWDC